MGSVQHLEAWKRCGSGEGCDGDGACHWCCSANWKEILVHEGSRSEAFLIPGWCRSGHQRLGSRIAGHEVGRREAGDYSCTRGLWRKWFPRLGHPSWWHARLHTRGTRDQMRALNLQPVCKMFRVQLLCRTTWVDVEQKK